MQVGTLCFGPRRPIAIDGRRPVFGGSIDRSAVRSRSGRAYKARLGAVRLRGSRGSARCGAAHSASTRSPEGAESALKFLRY